MTLYWTGTKTKPLYSVVSFDLEVRLYTTSLCSDVWLQRGESVVSAASAEWFPAYFACACSEWDVPLSLSSVEKKNVYENLSFYTLSCY